jgi:hypothetical protein
MFQTAIGRIGSWVDAGDRTLALSIFLDAGGQQSEHRLWGGLAVLDNRERVWLASALDALRAECPEAVETSGELKGKRLPLAVAKRAGQRLREEDRRILFWANWYPRSSDTDVRRVRANFLRHMALRQVDPHRLDRTTVARWFRESEAYFGTLPEVNAHKVLSILAHLQWLVGELARVDLARQLREVDVVVDREDFALPTVCARLVKSFLAASLQGAGMCYRLTGRAFREDGEEGAVRVTIHGESTQHPGLQYTDLLLQVVQQQLPGARAEAAV